jgi:hypothetical protein
MIPSSEQAKTVHALVRLAIVTGEVQYSPQIKWSVRDIILEPTF